MKRKKEMNSLKLSFLYLDYIFNLVTIIIFSIAIIFLVLSLLFLANPLLDIQEYLKNSESFHKNYFDQAILILQIFNGVLVTTIVILLMIQSQSFDALFIGSNKRIKISVAKIITGIILFLTLALIEFIILYFYPLVIFKNFKLGVKDLLTILYLFLCMSFSYFFSIFLTNIIQSIFIPMICLFLALAKNIITSTFSDIKEVISLLLPILSYDEGLKLNSCFILPLWIVFFITIYIFVYNIKDIKI